MTPWSPSVTSDDLLLEDVIPAWAWQACAVGAVGFACAAMVALNSAPVPALPGRSQTHTMLAVGGFVLAGLCAAGGAYFFKIRNNRWVYFNDRVEVYRGGGEPAHTVGYADVQRVVYGLQPDGKCEFLMFYGPDPKLKFTLNALWLDGRPNSRATRRSNTLRALRDRLNGVVATRMCAEAAAGGRPRWFDEVYITANGLVADGQLAPGPG
jgi:hypothetical protein